MLPYQIRDSKFYFKPPGDKPRFPAIVVVRMKLMPLQPFGMSRSGGRTGESGILNEYQGHFTTGRSECLTSGLKPLFVIFCDKTMRVRLRGNSLMVTTNVSDLRMLNDMIRRLYHFVPLLLLEFGDPPIVNHVDGRIDSRRFEWLASSRQDFVVDGTNQTLQEKRVKSAFDRFQLVNQQKYVRVTAALRYFHTACRLARVAEKPGEFTSEIIVNFAKVLGALFEGETRGSKDAARQGLLAIGFEKEEIEKKYVPVIELRSAVDGAHVKLASLPEEIRDVFQQYADSAERDFRGLLSRVLERVEQHAWVPSPGAKSEPARMEKMVSLMKARISQDPPESTVLATAAPRRNNVKDNRV